MAATLGKVAQCAGVAIDTARKALRGDPSVRPYLLERVQQAAKDLDYHPNLLARALRGNQLNLVPISVLELNQMYFGGLASSLSHRLVEIGMEPALCFNPEHLMRMSQTLSTSASILATGFDEKTVRALARRQKVVTVDSNLPAIAGVGNVAIDFRSVYREVVDALVKSGRTRIAFVSAFYHQAKAEGWFEVKFSSAMQRMDELGMRPCGADEAPVFASAEALAAWLFAAPGRADAVICENDVMAAHVMAWMATRRLKTPDDVLIVGSDANCLLRGMWSVKLDTDWLAAEAVGLLQRLLGGERKVEDAMHHPLLVDDQGQAWRIHLEPPSAIALRKTFSS